MVKTSLKNMKRPKLTDTVTERLIRAIRSGEFLPGDKLPTERELVASLGVSRNVIREAINELRSRGMVATRQGSGSVVTEEHHKPVRDVMNGLMEGQDGAEGKLLEVRRILEVHIAELAAQRATTAEIREMEELLDAFDAAGQDTRRCAELDRAFHQALCRGAHNELFGPLFEPLHDLLVKAHRHALDRAGVALSARHHRAVLNAIRRRDARGAGRAMASHIDTTISYWMKEKRY